MQGTFSPTLPPFLRDLLNLTADPGFSHLWTLSVFPLACTYSFVVICQYLDAPSAWDPQWPHLVGTCLCDSQDSSCPPFSPSVQELLANRSPFSHLNSIHWRHKLVVKTQGPYSHFIPKDPTSGYGQDPFSSSLKPPRPFLLYHLCSHPFSCKNTH